MTARENPRALDRDEAEMIDQSRSLDGMSHGDMTDLIKRLRDRRDRAQRLIRGRVRKAQADGGQAGPDTGARDKKAALTEAIDRVGAALEKGRTDGKASKATENLRKAVEAKAAAEPWRGPDDRTANTGPAETPNTRIAVSGALHAEGMRASISRSTGDR